MELAWGALGAIVTWQQAPTVPTNPSGDKFYGVIVTADDGQGHTGSDQAGAYIHETRGPGLNIAWDLSASGTWSFSCDVEEWASTYIPTAASLIDGTPFSSAGGAAQGDGLSARGVVFYELAKVGGTLTVHIDYGGASVTLSNPVTTAFPIGYIHVGTVNGAVFGASFIYNENATVQFDTGVVLPSQTWTKTDFDGTATATYSGRLLSLQTQNIPARTVGGHGSASGAVQPVTEYALSGRIMSFRSPFPAPGHTLTIQEKAGGTNSLLLNNSASTSWSQNHYNIAAFLQSTNFGPLVLDELSPVSCWLSGLSPDDPHDWRCMFRGFKWDAMTLAHAPSVTVDPCTALTHWTAGSNTTLSISGGHLKAVVAGGAGAFTLNVPSTVRVWEAFRYLQIHGFFTAPAYDNGRTYLTGELVLDAGITYKCILPTVGHAPPNATYWAVFNDVVAFTISIGSQTWNVNLKTTTSQPNTDLTCSTNDTTTVNGTQSRFPIVNPGGFPIATDPTNQYELGWGTNFCDTLIFGAIPDGYTIELTGVSLVESTSPQRQAALTLLEPFISFVDGWTSPSDQTTVQSYVFIETDYRPMDMPALAHIQPFSGGPSYRYYSLSEMQVMLAYFPGLTATLLPDPTDGYHNSGLEMLLAGAEGATYDWTALAWKDWVDVPVNTTIPAQDLWDEVQVYPGAGNVWDATAGYGGATPLLVSKSLRAQAWGIVFTLDGMPQNHVTVTVYETGSPSTGEGSGITNTLGFYLTDTPWAFGNVNSTVELQLPPLPHLTDHAVLQNRQRRRESFRHPSLGLGVDLTHDKFGIVYAVISGGTNLIATRFNFADVNDIFTAYSGTALNAGIACTPSRGLFIVFDDGTTSYIIRSTNAGQDWSSPVSVATGTWPEPCIDDLSGTEFIAISDGTTYHCYRKTNQETTFTNVGAIVSVTPGKSGMTVRGSVGRQVIFEVSDSGTVRRFVSTNMGVAWNEV